MGSLCRNWWRPGAWELPKGHLQDDCPGAIPFQLTATPFIIRMMLSSLQNLSLDQIFVGFLVCCRLRHGAPAVTPDAPKDKPPKQKPSRTKRLRLGTPKESTLVIGDVGIQKVGCELTTEPGRLGIYMTSNVVVEGLAYALEGARECQRADKVIFVPLLLAVSDITVYQIQQALDMSDRQFVTGPPSAGAFQSLGLPPPGQLLLLLFHTPLFAVWGCGACSIAAGPNSLPLNDIIGG